LIFFQATPDDEEDEDAKKNPAPWLWLAAFCVSVSQPASLECIAPYV
jgi:hypothetical protein